MDQPLPQPLQPTSSFAKDDSDENNDRILLDITPILDEFVQTHLSEQVPFFATADFDLHEAMAGTQLLDPKMDCCEIPSSYYRHHHNNSSGTDNNNYNNSIESPSSSSKMIFPRPVPSSLDDDFTPLPFESLSLADVTVIVIEILVRLQSLLCGASVAESTFTCLYASHGVMADMYQRLVVVQGLQDLHISQDHNNNNNNDPHSRRNENIPQWILLAATMGLVEITRSVRSIILSADIYEEEDFYANTHNIPFFQPGDVKSLGIEQEDPKARGDTKRILQTTMRLLREQEPCELVVLIKNALEFMLQFLSTITTLSRLTSSNTYKAVIQAQQKARITIEKLRNIQNIVPEEDYSLDEQSLIHQTFDPYVNRPLVGNLPVRKALFQKPRSAISILLEITSELDQHVCEIMLRASTLGRVHRMLDRVSRKPRKGVNILSRSLIVLNLYFEEKLLGQYPLPQLLSEHMLQWQTPKFPSFLPWNHSEHARAFLDRLAKPIYDCLKLKLLNRNRQRTYIDAIMLADWSNLQNEAQVTDMEVHVQQTAAGFSDDSPPAFFTRYVLAILIRLMDRYIESGLEVGLFHRHFDLSFAYWYRDFLLSALSQNLMAMRQTKECETVSESSGTTAPTTQSSSTKAKGKRKQKNKVAATTASTINGKGSHAPPFSRPFETPECQEDSLELKLIAVKRNLCRRTIQFLAALKQTGVVKEEHLEFTSYSNIFEKRFEVFAEIRHPPPLTYEHYLEGTDFSKIEATDLIQTVVDGFQHCRKMMDQIIHDFLSDGDTKESSVDSLYAAVSESELRSLIKVCIGNAVYAQKLRQLLESGGTGTATVSYDFESHDQFCIIKITS